MKKDFQTGLRKTDENVKTKEAKKKETIEVKQEGINKDGETEAGERDWSNSNSTTLGVLAEIYK